MHDSLHPKNAVLAYVFTELLIPEAIVVKENFIIKEAYEVPTISLDDDGVETYTRTFPATWASIALRGLEKDSWTARQKSRLPDGIRDEYFPFMIVEYFDKDHNPHYLELDLFEGLPTKPIFFIKSHFRDIYDERRSNKNKNIDFPPIRRAIGIVPTIEDKWIHEYSLEEISPGVIMMNLPMREETIRILNIEALPNEPHNASVKILSLDQEEREAAWKVLQGWGVKRIPEKY